ncbi:MAG: hypothetical protein LBF57_01965 [Holosporaceae bacterium]|jgi:hypothetical protein|nr:hypothetical protein [Holosporaceae bacterium]
MGIVKLFVAEFILLLSIVSLNIKAMEYPDWNTQADALLNGAQPCHVIGITKESEILLDDAVFLSAALHAKHIGQIGEEQLRVLLETCERFYTKEIVALYHSISQNIQRIKDPQLCTKFLERFAESNNKFFALFKNIMRAGSIDLVADFFNDQREEAIKKNITTYFQKKWATKTQQLKSIPVEFSSFLKLIIFNEYFFSKQPLLQEEIRIIRSLINTFLKAPDVMIIYNLLSIEDRNPTPQEEQAFTARVLMQNNFETSLIVRSFVESRVIENRPYTGVLINYSIVTLDGIDLCYYKKSSYCDEHNCSLLAGRCYSFGDFTIHSLDAKNLVSKFFVDYCCMRTCMDTSIPRGHNHIKYFYIVQSNYLRKENFSKRYCPSRFYILCDARNGTNVFVQHGEISLTESFIMSDEPLAKTNNGTIIAGVRCDEIKTQGRI